MRKLLAQFLCLVLTACLATNTLSQTAPSAPCSVFKPTGYSLGYFNGVWNSIDEANDNLDRLMAQMSMAENASVKGQRVQRVLFYNHTAGKAADVYETFIQRANSTDPSGTLASRVEFLTLAGSSFIRHMLTYAEITTQVPGARDFFAQLASDFSASSVVSLMNASPTLKDSAEHIDQLNELIGRGQKILLVAHSQGNLFMNKAYSAVLPSTTTTSLKVVHVAPASTVTHGKWILADIDIVINGLRGSLTGAVPPITHHIPVSKEDPSGHQFILTYLDPARAAFSGSSRDGPGVQVEVANALAALTDPSMPAYRICGTVSDGTKGIVGATVGIYSNGKWISTTSATAGRYALTLDTNQLSRLPDEFAVIAYDAPDYNSDSVALNRTTSNNTVQNFNLAKIVDNPQIYSLELVPQIHHLGDSSYSGTQNSQFQIPTAEGLSFSKTFSLSAVQSTYQVATLVFKAKGIQYADQLDINGTKFGLTPSDAGGGYTSFTLPLGSTVPSRLLKKDGNTFTLTSVLSTDYDDFEFVDVKIQFKY